MDFTKITEKLENKDYKVVADLCALVNNDGERETHLVDLLATYFESTGQTAELLNWAIQWEVERTDSPNNLFRLESVATALMFRLFFTEKGMLCLKTTVCPLIERVCAKVAANTEKDYSQNVRVILKQTRKFIEELETSVVFFPLEIREGLRVLSVEVQKKYPKTKNAVSVLLFLRFMCPSIIQAHTFGIIKDPVPPTALKVLLQVAKVLQCVANEQVENKITPAGQGQEKILAFIQKSMQPIRDFARRLINEEEIFLMKKIVTTPSNALATAAATATATAPALGLLGEKPSAGPASEKARALQAIIDYISGPEFPMPSLQLDNKARQLPTLLKSRKLVTLDNKIRVLEEVLNSVKINLVYLLDRCSSELFKRIMDETTKISSELEYLGVKQIMITGGDLAAANQFEEECRFKGEIYIDSSCKIHQLFQMRARKQSTRTMYSTKMQIIRSKASDRIEIKPEKIKNADKEQLKPVKMYVLFGDNISFESKFEGTPEDLVNLLQACGAKPEVVATYKNKLKKKRKTSFWTLKRTTSTFKI